jgi:hypothetical protein
MFRIRTTVILAALLCAGTALGEAPPWQQGLPPAAPLPGGVPVSASPAPACDAPVATDTGPDYFLWGKVRYLLGWVKGDPIPVLVTSSPPGTPQASAGVLGANGTAILFGGRPANTSSRSGVSLDLGYWFTADHCFGVEVGAFVLGGATSSFNATSSGTPILARPFVDTTTSQAASSLVAFPGSSAGTLQAADVAHKFYGGNLDLRENICCCSTPEFRLDCLLGYRGLDYSERLLIQQTVVPTNGVFVAGTAIRSLDSFATRNIFNGINIGLSGEYHVNDFFVDVTTRVAAGHVSQHLNIQGVQNVAVPGQAPVTSLGGQLALVSNIGTHPHTTWTGVPELAVSLGYQFTPNIRASVGYWALWWLNTVRPGDEVDILVNRNLLPPATRTPVFGDHPALSNHGTDLLWVQALTFSLEFRY